jgi:DNA mismatch repair protein MSH6
MNRQKSILSFFHKTSPENRTSGGAQSSAPSFQQTDRNVNTVVNPPPPADDVRGTDTPPEKVPRKVLPANFASNANNSGSSLFESIMHKFIKVVDGDIVNQRFASFSFVLSNFVIFCLFSLIMRIDMLGFLFMK